MTFLDRLEKRFGSWAVPNVGLYLVLAQIAAYTLILSQRVTIESLLLAPTMVLGANEYWRLMTFLFCPPFVAGSFINMLFLGFYWYIFWMVCNALEGIWGAFRFNCYVLLGIVCAIVGVFIGHFISPQPAVVVLPKAIYWSMFLAFAVFHPNIQFMLMLVIPVKVKWLAWLLAGYIGYLFLIVPTIGYKVALIAPLLNFFLFFRRSFIGSVQATQRRKQFQAEKNARDNEAFHICSVCGATDQTHPDRHFRYKTMEGEAVAICDHCRKD